MIDEQQLPTLGRLARRTVATCLGAFQNRTELLALEFEEENDRLLRLVIFGVSGLFLAMMTLLLITATIIFLFPEADRIWAALGFAALYLVGTVAAGIIIRGLLKRVPFVESINQIKKDGELLDAFK